MTVLFADVVHSMDIAKQVGAERLREIMAQLMDCASAVVQRYGGTVDKFTGDGIMAVFGAPVALEDHALRACLAALGIQEQVDTVRLRIGLNSGQVIAGEVGSGAGAYTTIGEHVGIAQRMESVAPVGGVMLSASTARLVENVAKLSDPEMVHIKGADEPVAARRLLGVSQNRVSVRPESNLVGRQWEMSALGALLDRAISGHGGVVGVVGPPGIGKSRLTRELSALAGRRGVDVFTTHCESHTSKVPFHVVTNLFRAATGVEGLEPVSARELVLSQQSDVDAEDRALFEDLLGIGDPDNPLPQIDPDARRRRLTALVNAASIATKIPAVYVIEDAHWIDESSESLFAGFLAVVPQTPLLTVITYRPEYRGTLANMPGAQTFTLAPLSDPETATLVSDLLGRHPSIDTLAQTIVERASGTPFFAEEIVLELAERGLLRGRRGAYEAATQAAEVSVPATLQATIASRIDRLDPGAKRTLSAAAVIGSRFGTNLLSEIGIEPVVDDLLTAQLIHQVVFTARPEFVFHHPLIRTVAYEAQLKSDRADLHQRVAAAIQRQSGASADENAALIAEHLEAAGDLRAAFDWHMRAGEWSKNRDIAAARASWDRARRVADLLPDDLTECTAMRIAPRTMLCASAWRVHADDSAVRYAELRELCVLAADTTSLAIGIMGPMAVHTQRGEVPEAHRLASELMTLCEAIGDPALTAQAGFSSIAIMAQHGEMGDVARWAQATVDWSEGDPTKGNLVVASPLAAALAMRGIARSWFGHHGWRADLDQAVEFARQSAEPLTLAMAMSWNFGTGVWNGVRRADDTAVRTTESALKMVVASGDNYAVNMMKWLLASVLIIRRGADDRRRALELLPQLSDIFVQQRIMGAERPILDIYLARARAGNDGRDTTISVVRRAVDTMTGRGQIGYYIPAIGELVALLVDRGTESDLAEAQDAISKLEAAPADGSAMRDIWVLRMRTVLARAHGDESGYRELRDRYREMATSFGFEGHMAWAKAMP